MKLIGLTRAPNISPLIILCFFYMLIPREGQSQFNISTGYSISYLNPTKLNSIVSDFNDGKEWLTKDFKPLHLFHGMHFGVRYKHDIIGLELNWTSKFNKSLAEGIDPLTENDFYKKLRYRNHSISFAIENIIQSWAYGASIDMNWFVIKSQNASNGTKDRIVFDNNWGSQFFLTYHTNRTRGVALAIRPYVQILWNDIEISGLQKELIGDNQAEVLEKYLSFGISFIFYNGN